MDDKADKKRFKKLALIERERKIAIDEFVREAMKIPQGRLYFNWLLEMSGVNRNPFTSNALTTSFVCGELNVGQQIQAHLVEIAPEDYIKMLQATPKETENDDRNSSTDNYADDTSGDD